MGDRQQPKIALPGVLGLFIALLFACGGATDPGSSTTPADATDDETGATTEESSDDNPESVSATITKLEFVFDDANQASLELPEITTDAEYVLMLQAYAADGLTQAFQVGGSENAAAPTITAAFVTGNPTEDLHERLREAEQFLAGEAFANSATPKTKAALKNLGVGATRSFKVLKSFADTSQYQDVAATLVYASAYFNAYVDTRNLQDFVTSGRVADFATSELAHNLENFAAVLEDEVSLFGTTTDVDGDGKFNILFTQQVNELSTNKSSITTGYFYAVDLFGSSSYAQSNETEIIYAAIPDPAGKYGAEISKSFAHSNIIPSVLPHELQHLINFNQHYFLNDKSIEESFLNEGLSHLAEDIYSMNESGYMEQSGIENYSRVAQYLAASDTICFSCGASLSERGGSYLFLRYLYDQAQMGNLAGADSGANLLANLLDTNLTGVENLTFAASARTADADFLELLGNFSLAVYLDGYVTGTSNRYIFSGLNLRGLQNDNRDTELTGPPVAASTTFPLRATMAGTAISYVNLTAAQLQEMAGIMQLAGSSDGKLGATLVEILPE